jgi:hypothetical protein
MNRGEVFWAMISSNKMEGMRPVVIIDNEYVKPLTTMNKRNFIPCIIDNKELYIVPEKLRLRDVTLHDFITTITIE